MTKVAIVTPELSHFEVPLFRIAASLEGIDVRVFHNDLREDEFMDLDYGTTITWGERMKAGFPNVGFTTFGELEAELFAWVPDAVLFYGLASPGLLRLLWRLKRKRIPVLHRGTMSPLYDPRAKGLTRRLRRALRPLLLHAFDGHHYGGTYSKKVLSDACISPSRCYFVPYSVDSPHFLKESERDSAAREGQNIRSRFGWSKDDPVMLLIGQLTWVKGADRVVDIVERLQKNNPRVKLLVVGSGPLLESCIASATERLLSASFNFVGFVSSKSTVPYYLASTAVIFPSRYETWARAVNEAMLCGRCCIVTSRVAAAGGLVEHGENGYVVDEPEPGPFAERIAEFLSLPPERRTEMGEAARARAQYFSYEAHIDELRRSFVETVDHAQLKRERGHA
jgi:glycosyltransferase involved in cell wall biosynthesis